MRLEGNTHCRYTPDCGKVPAGETVECGVCGEVMTETRNVEGPRGIAQALAKGKSLHDFFECPHYKADWHKQAVKLREEAARTPSKKFESLLLEEADSIVATQKATKIVW